MQSDSAGSAPSSKAPITVAVAVPIAAVMALAALVLLVALRQRRRKIARPGQGPNQGAIVADETGRAVEPRSQGSFVMVCCFTARTP